MTSLGDYKKGMGDMDILRELRESGLKVTIPRLRILQPVSYTHLTLPTIYSV